MSARETIIEIYQAAVEAVEPRSSVRANLERVGDWRLRTGGHTIAVPPGGVYIVALGKAAVPMAQAARSIVGALYRAGIAITKDRPSQPSSDIEVVIGSHPVPDRRSFDAGERLLSFVAGVPDDALVIVLISGGGSSLVEAPAPGVSRAEIRELTSTLLRAGANIHELNAVRSRLSRIKGGGLLRAIGNARVLNLILSDVIGNDLETVASGPTVPSTAAGQVEDVLQRYGISYDLPALPRTTLTKPASVIIGSIEQALDVARQTAIDQGYTPVLLSSSLEGEAREVAKVMARIAADAAGGRSTFRPGHCLLAGGEMTVTVTGNGQGGRNTEAALSAAITIAGIEGVTIGFLASDGDDAETGAAGAIVDGATIPPDEQMKAAQALADNDSFTFLQGREAIHAPGPTGTNVNDLVIAVIDEASNV